MLKFVLKTVECVESKADHTLQHNLPLGICAESLQKEGLYLFSILRITLLEQILKLGKSRTSQGKQLVRNSGKWNRNEKLGFL